MADLKILRVMVNLYAFLVLVFVCNLVTEASFCGEKQFLNVKLQICQNCTACKDGFIVIRPCESHRDTHCGPLSAISDLLVDNIQHRHRHEKYREEEQPKQQNIEWRYGEDMSGDLAPPVEISEAMEVSSANAPFTKAETLVWDWQAVALTSAVFACLMFFLVIALYSFIQARQWRRLKENFESDVEELSARLSLMAAASTEKCEFLGNSEPVFVSNPSSGTESNYLSNKCLYLEQLINDRKDEKKNNTIPRGNVYIEESKKAKK